MRALHLSFSISLPPGFCGRTGLWVFYKIYYAIFANHHRFLRAGKFSGVGETDGS